jgi:release factor glutamine methyltransferase
VTTGFANSPDEVVVASGVYAPQQDSRLLCEVMEQTGTVPGRRVLDLCTGSGIVAIKAARLGASAVTALDVSAAAVRCARENALAAGADVRVQLGTHSSAMKYGPYDVVVSNPPYVPQPPEDDLAEIPEDAGPARAFNAGIDGRRVLDPLCERASELLADEGTLLIVHSEFSDIAASLRLLRQAGLKASVVARRWIPFGPVLHARAHWLEQTGRLQYGRRTEELVAIRADVP